MTHALKVWPEFFESLDNGVKNFELRKADRPFKIGDRLLLQEYEVGKGYSGVEIERRISYILDDPDFGLKKGYVILGLEKIES